MPMNDTTGFGAGRPKGEVEKKVYSASLPVDLIGDIKTAVRETGISATDFMELAYRRLLSSAEIKKIREARKALQG